MRAVAVLILCLTVAGCTDQFTERYSTLEEARRNQLFERGWLPDVLPTSSHSLRVSGDVDINAAQGEFSFQRAEFEGFVAKLLSMPAKVASDIVVERTSELENEGYIARAFTDDQYTWIFLCSREREHCEYYGWAGALDGFH
jgi:hypothetical protein